MKGSANMPKKPPRLKTPSPPVRKATRKEHPPVNDVTIAVPVCEYDERASVVRHIEIKLSHTQAIALNSVYNGLQASHAQILHDNQEVGRSVHRFPDAIRFLLQEIYLAMTMPKQLATSDKSDASDK